MVVQRSLLSKVQKVYKTDAYAGNDTIVATGQTIQLNGAGGDTL